MEGSGSGDKVPMYSRIGWIISWFAILFIIVLTLKVFVSDTLLGRGVKSVEVERYYAMGVADGRLGQSKKLPLRKFDNALFNHAYTKGFREGHDILLQKRKSEEENSRHVSD